jgi:hypothetical protein
MTIIMTEYAQKFPWTYEISNYLPRTQLEIKRELKIIQNFMQHSPKHLRQNWKPTLPLLWDTSVPSSFAVIYTTFILEQSPC